MYFNFVLVKRVPFLWNRIHVYLNFVGRNNQPSGWPLIEKSEFPIRLSHNMYVSKTAYIEIEKQRRSKAGRRFAVYCNSSKSKVSTHNCARLCYVEASCVDRVCLVVVRSSIVLWPLYQVLESSWEYVKNTYAISLHMLVLPLNKGNRYYRSVIA